MSASVVPAEYEWLRDALAPHCDRVICDVCDYGERIGIGVCWNGPPRERQALIVHRALRYEPKRDLLGRFLPGPPVLRVYDLNADIAAGEDTRERVIAALLERKR